MSTFNGSGQPLTINPPGYSTSDQTSYTYDSARGDLLPFMKRGRGGVQYKDIVEGAGEIASRGSTVEIRYSLKLNRGEILQENVYESFTLGERRVIAGLEYGVEGMRVGGQRLVRVGPHLGYRDRGVEGVIPKNAVLEFDILLLAVQPSAVQSLDR